MRAPKTTLKHFGYLQLLILSFLFFNLNAQQLAFPSAKGAGAYASGGRGGQVIHVTTLNWEGPGSLKEAIQTPGPRIVVFDVSGEIDATSEGDYSCVAQGSQYDNITIAGQTAPAGGITIRTNEWRFCDVDNVIIRYIRYRGTSYVRDTVSFWGNTDLIFDHCTFSHGGDEAGSWADSSGTMDNITIQNCFFQDSKTGTIVGVDDEPGDFSLINNVWSSISHRFPNPKGDGRVDIINNVVYNWKYRLVNISGQGEHNVINNYYKGSANPNGGINNWFTNYDITPRYMHKVQTNASYRPTIYTTGSVIYNQRTAQIDDSDMWTAFAGSHIAEHSAIPSNYFTSTQFPLLGQSFTIKTAEQAFVDVLADVGANKTLNADGSIYPYQDTKDAGDVLMIQNDTYSGDFYSDWITEVPYPVVPQNTRSASFDSNNDGIPDLWKASRGFGPDEDLSNYVWPSGYIGIEEYLNEIDLNGIAIVEVTGVEVTPEIATINMPNTVDLTATVLPVNATNQSGNWSSSNDAIATVNNNGLVTPVAEGVVTITFTTNDGNFIDEALISVTNILTALEEVIVTPEAVTLDLGESIELITEFIPINTSDTSGTWSSSDQSIASVDDNGTITAIGIGEAIITFTANDGGFTDSSTVTVVDEFFGTYILYNADTDQEIQNIEGDASINLENETSQINFRSIPEGGDANANVESVKVDWTGPTSGTWTESDPIYAALPSGHVDLDFEPYTVSEGTYNFTVTYYSGNGASGDVVAVDTFSLTFFFNSLPSANVGPDQEICEGETATLTVSGGPNFLWDNGETTATIEVSPTETTTYTVTAFDAEGNTAEDSVTVTVNSIPNADAGEDQTTCEGESVTLTATGGTSYLWSTGETTASIAVSPAVETTYDVEVISNNCSSTDSVTVLVNDLPDITVSEDIVLIEGESTTLTANGGDNYLWSTNETTESITVNPISTTTYTVSSINANGCTSYAEVTVTVIPEVIAEAGEDVTICNGESTTLNASGGVTYSWNTGDTGSQLIVSPTVTTTYTVTVEDDYGYTDTDTVTITVNEIPNITVNDDVFVMIGNSATLTASGANSYSWSTGETTASITVTPDVTTTYTVIGYSENGCQITADVLVTVVEELNANAGEDASICIGESITLSASGGVTYVWNTGATGTSPTFSPTETTTYTVTVTDGFGNSDSDDVTITVNPLPTAYAGEDQSVCAGESVTLSASGGDSYLWSTGATSATITVNPTEDTIYTVEVISNNCSDTDEVAVFTNEGPNISLSGNSTIFSGDFITLVATGGETYLWSTGQTSNSITVNPEETTTYTVTGYSSIGCSTTAEVTVTVIPELIANAGNDVTICSGESVTLNASGGISYTWNTGDTGTSPTFSPTQTTTYTVTVSDVFGNLDSDSVTVTVNELPNISLSADITIIEGENTVLTVNGADTYLWNTGETASSITVSPTTTTTYSVTGFSNGCETTDEVTVTVIPEVIANAGNDVAICFGESVTLNASGGTNYSWNTGDTGSSPTFSPTQTTTYTVTVSDNFGNSDTDSVTVTVNELPVITVSENVTIIEGESTTLSANGAETYQWNTGETSSTILVSPTQTTTYTVFGSSNSCNSEQLEVTVTVTQLFVANAGEDERVCDNQTYEVVLTANEGDSYLWSTGETTQSIVVSPTSTYTYSVTVTQGQQEDTDDVTVYVDLSPEVVIANGESVEILNGDFITLSASGANTYEWNNGATQPNIAVSPSTTTTYEVRGYIGDCYDDKQITVNVLQPVIADAGEDIQICLNEMATLTASGGDEYVWSTGETTQSIEVSPAETTDYTVTVFNALDFDEATVTVEVDANCTDQSSNPSGIPKDFKFDVYPNPASNIVNVKFSGVLVVSDVHIYAVTGKLIQRTKISNENISTSSTIQIDISSLQQGVYFVKLIGEEQDITKKLIVR